MGLDTLVNIYKPLATKEGQPNTNDTPPPLSWRDSAPVVALSSYLREHGGQGIRLYNSPAGTPALCFKPGLNKNDWEGERGRIATEAAHLLLLAVDDLNYLINNALLVLPNTPPCEGTKEG